MPEILLTFSLTLYGEFLVLAGRPDSHLPKSSRLLKVSTGLTLWVTLTAQLAVFPPSSVLTVMVAFPADTPATVPPATVATALLLLLHDTFLFSALEGETVAVKVS
jgi:hypothetical protein